MARTWPAALLLLTAAILAGCTSNDAPAADAPSNGNGAGTGTQTPAPNQPPATSDGGSAPSTAKPPRPAPEPVARSGDVSGEFTDAWEIRVPSPAARGMTLHFNLTGAEAGLPPTATVHLKLLDPNGQALRSGTAGIAGAADALAWTLAPEEVATPGAYLLQATTADPGAPAPVPGASVPSAGLAKYQLYAWVEY